MDEKDLIIYKMLNEDGKTKLVDLSKVLGFTHPSTSYRLKKLLAGGDIKIKGLLNAKKKSWKTAVCNIRAETMEEAAKLAEGFKNCPRVIHVQTMTGTYNLLLIIMAKDTTILDCTVENALRPIPSIKKLDISIGDAPIFPDFLDIRIFEPQDKPPCGGKGCANCYFYKKKCEGCPATKYWGGFE